MRYSRGYRKWDKSSRSVGSMFGWEIYTQATIVYKHKLMLNFLVIFFAKSKNCKAPLRPFDCGTSCLNWASIGGETEELLIFDFVLGSHLSNAFWAMCSLS